MHIAERRAQPALASEQRKIRIDELAVVVALPAFEGVHLQFR